jgi:D-lactate dehydrogenase
MVRGDAAAAPRSCSSSRSIAQADAVYFPACISRIMGALPGEAGNLDNMQALLNIADARGVKLRVPKRHATGNCCGVPFSSKGFEAAQCSRGQSHC